MATETEAKHKYSCPACGAEANWNPSRQELACAFCGTTSPAQMELDGAGKEVIRELDLAVALRGVPDDKRGWSAQKTSVRCQSCKAISVFDPERVAQRCDFCGSASLVPYEQIKEAFRPESLLAFKVPEAGVRESIRSWYGSRWFAPNSLKDNARTDTVKGIYIPYWTFDAQADAQWDAESGYYYYETETYTDAQGKRQTRRVRKTRWVPSHGSLSHFFDDELVPASLGVSADLLRKIEPFPTKELVAYNAGFVAGWVVERYQIDLVRAAQHSREQMDRAVVAMCEKQVPGDTHRGLRVRTQYSAQTFKHILTPVWLLTYRHGSRHYQVVINGYTGEIAGQHPLSWIKILLLVFAILIAVGVFALIAQG